MEPRTVYIARNNSEASIVKSWLDQEGIEATIFNGEMSGGGFDIVDSDPQVIVSEEDFERAQAVVTQYQSELQQETDMSTVSDAEGQFDWPICPMCDELRYAECQKCNTVGSEFSTEETEAGSRVICLACSEETTISYMDKCKFCEHDFEQDPDRSDQSSLAESLDTVNLNRVLLLLVGLGILAALGLWFFVYIK